MKGVITAAGLGTRSGLDGKLRKEMLPVYDVRDGKLVLRPIIDVIITNMLSSGISDIAVVIDIADRWTREYLETEFPKVKILYQKEKLGFGHAVLMSKDFVGKDDFILNAGDGVVLNGKTLKELLKGKENGVFLTLMQVNEPEKYGTAEIISRGGEIEVNGVVEKSPNPPSNFALCALYRLPAEIFTYLSRESGKNIELTPAINSLIQNGIPTRAVVIDKKEWISVGRAESYVEVLSSTLGKCRKILTS